MHITVSCHHYCTSVHNTASYHHYHTPVCTTLSVTIIITLVCTTLSAAVIITLVCISLSVTTAITTMCTKNYMYYSPTFRFVSSFWHGGHSFGLFGSAQDWFSFVFNCTNLSVLEVEAPPLCGVSQGVRVRSCFCFIPRFFGLSFFSLTALRCMSFNFLSVNDQARSVA